MEQLSLSLILLTFFETFLLALLIYSLLTLKIFDKKFFLLLILLTLSQLIVRNFPVIPLIIMLTIIIIYMIYIKYVYHISILITFISVTLSYLIYMLIEGVNVPILIRVFDINFQNIINNFLLRLLFFSIQALLIIIIISLIRYFKINLRFLIKDLSFEELKILAQDEIDLSREKRVTITFYLVIIFLLIQGLFININILIHKLYEYFNIGSFFTSPLFINIVIVILNFVFFYLLRHLIVTLRMERNDIIERVKEKNSLRLDWEKRAQIHDRNHHLSMLYMLLQVNNIERAKEYLNGMVGEIQNVDAVIKSGNQALNALVLSKIARARQYGVMIKIDTVNSLAKMNISDWELNRIIGNLLDNAIEAAERNKSKKVVELIIDGRVKSNRIEVITQGVVIPDEIEARIFQKGYSSKEETGHGLGLAICKELVVEYNGNIIIHKDKEKKYTSFQVILPVSPKKEVK